MTFDEPIGIDEQAWEAYSKKRAGWIQTMLAQPGVKELRAYVNPYQSTPTGMGCWKFDNLASIQAYLASEAAIDLTRQMRSAGCANITYQIWDNSPVLPDPIKPGG